MSKPFFYIYETVDFPLHLTAEDLQPVLVGYKNIIISLGQYNTVILEKDTTSSDVGIDVENDTINLHLTQDDTGKFTPNVDVQIQVNILYDDASRDTTVQGVIDARENLHASVME